MLLPFGLVGRITTILPLDLFSKSTIMKQILASHIALPLSQI